jgi:Pyridoxamine 5'-phosphate oxidase
LRQPSLCFLATVMPDGSPQATQTWVDTNAIRGRVIGITAEGGAEHIEALAHRYLGTPYPWYGGHDQVRVILTIEAARIGP